jgi:pimeloyl-ACP methyl ester carboxylesterase
MVAARNNDMAFVVLMASPGIRGDKLLLMQQELIGRAVGMSENAIAENRVMHEQLFAKIVASSEPDTLQTGLTAWMLQFLKYDPATALERVKCPVLAINGDKDLQVPAETNLEAIYKALKRGNNQQVTIKQFSGLNHLFQECITGSPTEYGVIEQTISPISLDVITDWLKMVVKK